MKTRLLGAAAAIIALAFFAPATSAQAAAAKDNYLAVGDSVTYGVGVSTPYPELVDALSRGIELADNLSTSGGNVGDVAAQLLSYSKRNEIRELTITVGANDIGWTDALMACLGASDCANDAALNAGLTGLSSNLLQLLIGANALYPNATISVTGYYELFGDKAKACTVAPGVSVTVANKTWLNQAVKKLNATIKAAAVSAGGRVVYVDVAKAFNGHGLCDTGLPWVISGLRPAAAGHPNILGQAAYAAVLYGAGVR